MSLRSEQTYNPNPLISELSREQQQAQENRGKEALFFLEFVDGSVNVSLSLILLERPPLSSPQLHLKISVVPLLENNEQLPRQYQNLIVSWPNRSMIKDASNLFNAINDLLNNVKKMRQINTPTADSNTNLPRTAQELLVQLNTLVVLFKPKSVDSGIDENS